MKTSIEFRIYVGTYSKYNDGSLFGKWMNLTDYESLAEFYKACRKLHKDEEDPELMFQDWEYIPGFLISESSLHPETFNYLEVTSEMDDERREGFELYCTHIASWPEAGKDIQQQLESFNESYQGYFSGSTAKEDFAYQFVEDTGMITDANPTIHRYFDYSAFARDLFLDGYTEIDGHVFTDY